MDNRTRQDARPERALTGPDERTIAIDRKDRIMKFVCPVCGYVEEFDGDQLPEDFKCPQCGAFKLPHRACKACGSYDGRQVLKVDEEKK